MMLFTTPTQFAALALCLLAGWLLGLASHPGGRKWKARYAAERDAHATYRKQGDTALADANRRIAELEQDNARLTSTVQSAQAAPVAAAPAWNERVTRRQTVARPAYSGDTRPGWFDFGPRRRM